MKRERGRRKLIKLKLIQVTFRTRPKWIHIPMLSGDRQATRERTETMNKRNRLEIVVTKTAKVRW